MKIAIKKTVKEIENESKYNIILLGSYYHNMDKEYWYCNKCNILFDENDIILIDEKEDWFCPIWKGIFNNKRCMNKLTHSSKEWFKEHYKISDKI